MNVGELIHELQAFRRDVEVFVSSDSEGNHIRAIDELDTRGYEHLTDMVLVIWPGWRDLEDE